MYTRVLLRFEWRGLARKCAFAIQIASETAGSKTKIKPIKAWRINPITTMILIMKTES